VKIRAPPRGRRVPGDLPLARVRDASVELPERGDELPGRRGARVDAGDTGVVAPPVPGRLGHPPVPTAPAGGLARRPTPADQPHAPLQPQPRPPGRRRRAPLPDLGHLSNGPVRVAAQHCRPALQRFGFQFHLVIENEKRRRGCGAANHVLGFGWGFVLAFAEDGALNLLEGIRSMQQGSNPIVSLLATEISIMI
jgi:hypothetical protein